MKAKKVLEKYPLGKEAMREWFLNKMIKSFEGFEEDDHYKEAVLSLGINDSQLEILINGSPRSLIDLFDASNIYIGFVSKDGLFKYTMNDVRAKSEWLPRIVIEELAMLEGLSMLELQLTPEVEEVIELNELEPEP